jgi:CarD family transcriptional regulator
VPDRPTTDTATADKAVAAKTIAAKPQARPAPAAPPRPNRPGFAAPAQAVAPAPPPEPERRPNINDRNPPRVPSKAENFVEGDHVVYPTHGVGKVERIAVEEIAGHSLELIHITFEENRMTLRVPVSKARSAGLRKLASRKMFDEALAVLKGRARIKRTMWSRRAQEYEAKINSGDPLAIAEVVRDLHRNAGQPDQSFSERQIYEAAMDRLAAELGALDKTDKATAVIKLANFLKTIV